MQALKGTWVGKTFALSKANESGGKKSRIRRSKEERKEMVEFFIKKYQKLNNGNFPSLSLTHKEVGGSFYTVREIVREIIQENRVLGPAKSIPKEQNTYQLLEQNPLGSISIEPQVPLLILSNESHFVPDHHQGRREELVSIPDGLSNRPGHQRLDGGQTINGNCVDVQSEESDKKTIAELKVSEPFEVEKSVNEVAAITAKVTHVTEDIAETTATVTGIAASVIVETFPLRPATKPTNGLDGQYGEIKDVSGTLEDNEIEKVDLGPDNGNGKPTALVESSPGNSGLVGQKGMGKTAALLSEGDSALVEKEAMENLEDLPLESFNCSTNKDGTVHDALVGTDAEIKVSHNDILTPQTVEQTQPISGTKARNSPNGIPSVTVNDTCTGGSGVSTIQDAAVIENKLDGQHSVGPKKGSNTTLNRIKPESWEGASKNVAEPENNPLFSIFKSFIAAFVKFWSE